MKTYRDVDEYIENAEEKYRDVLCELRFLVRDTVPDSEEGIAYGMPAYKWRSQPLFYFAAMKGHLGLYPTPGPIIDCADMLSEYSTSKGCVRVPYSSKFPKTLIVKLLKARIREIKNNSK